MFNRTVLLFFACGLALSGWQSLRLRRAALFRLARRGERIPKRRTRTHIASTNSSAIGTTPIPSPRMAHSWSAIF